MMTISVEKFVATQLKFESSYSTSERPKQAKQTQAGASKIKQTNHTPYRNFVVKLSEHAEVVKKSVSKDGKSTKLQNQPTNQPTN